VIPQTKRALYFSHHPVNKLLEYCVRQTRNGHRKKPTEKSPIPESHDWKFLLIERHDGCTVTQMDHKADNPTFMKAESFPF
jgi:hypothetical protein